MKLFLTGITDSESNGKKFHRHRWINLNYVIGVDLHNSEEEFSLNIWMADGMNVPLSGEKARLFLKLPEVRESVSEIIGAINKKFPG